MNPIGKSLVLLSLGLAISLLACGCGSSGSGEGPAASSSGTAKAAPTGTAASTGAATATATAAAEVPTKNLTPGQIRDNAAKLLGKEIQGSGLMYEYETGTLNKAVFYYGYIADDDKKTASFKCVLAADPKIPKGTKVTFEGKWMGGWVDGCKIAAQK